MARHRPRPRVSAAKMRELEAAIHKTPPRSAARKAARRRFYRALAQVQEREQ